MPKRTDNIQQQSRAERLLNAYTTFPFMRRCINNRKASDLVMNFKYWKKDNKDKFPIEESDIEFIKFCITQIKQEGQLERLGTEEIKNFFLNAEKEYEEIKQGKINAKTKGEKERVEKYFDEFCKFNINSAYIQSPNKTYKDPITLLDTNVASQIFSQEGDIDINPYSGRQESVFHQPCPNVFRSYIEKKLKLITHFVLLEITAERTILSTGGRQHIQERTKKIFGRSLEELRDTLFKENLISRPPEYFKDDYSLFDEMKRMCQSIIVREDYRQFVKEMIIQNINTYNQYLEKGEKNISVETRILTKLYALSLHYLIGQFNKSIQELTNYEKDYAKNIMTDLHLWVTLILIKTLYGKQEVRIWTMDKDFESCNGIISHGANYVLSLIFPERSSSGTMIDENSRKLKQLLKKIFDDAILRPKNLWVTDRTFVGSLCRRERLAA